MPGLTSPNGLIVIASTSVLDEAWGATPNRPWGVDFSGPNAEYLSGRQKQFAHTILADGTHRLTAPNKVQAKFLCDDAHKLMSRDTPRFAEDTVKATSLGAPSTMAHDATRGEGLGQFSQGPLFGLAVKARGITITGITRDEQGRPLSATISFSH